MNYHTIIGDLRYTGLIPISMEEATEKFGGKLLFKSPLFSKMGIVTAKDFKGTPLVNIKEWINQHSSRKDLEYFTYLESQTVFSATPTNSTRI